MEKIFFSDEGARKKQNRLNGFTGYQEAHDAGDLAKKVIKDYHPHLSEAKIAYLYRPGRWMKRNRPVKGRAMVIPPLWRHLCGSDLVLILSEVIFKNLSEEGKIALLDHELSHFNPPAANGRGAATWSIREHDVREFSEVVKRRKICMSNLGAIAEGEGLMVQLDIMSLTSTVENPEAVAAVYSNDAEVIEEEEDLFCEDYEEL